MNTQGISIREWGRKALGVAACALGMFVLHGAVAQAASPTLAASDVSGYQWQGSTASGQLGRALANVGDINGDGRDDFAATSSSGVWVLFAPLPRSAQLDFADLAPDRGYLIKTTGNPVAIRVGDQSGDDTPDIAIAQSVGWKIVYGVADPATDLARCDTSGTSRTRCVDIAQPATSSGARLSFEIRWLTSGDYIRPSDGLSAGDIDGDGKTEMVLPIASDAGAATRISVLGNGLGDQCDPDPSVACVVDVSTLPQSQTLQILAPAGVGIGGLLAPRQVVPGDIDGDGRDDIVTSLDTDGATPPSVKVVKGTDLGSPDIHLDGLSGSAGFSVTAPFEAAALLPFATGDVNADGLADFAVTSFSLVGGLSTTLWYGQEPASGSTINAPAAGDGYRYVAGPNTPRGVRLVLTALGDINGDGADEIAFGDNSINIGGSNNTGIVGVLFGRPGSPSGDIPLDIDTPTSDAIVIEGSIPGGKFGSTLARSDDLDGDGRPELLASATAADSNKGRVITIESSGITPSAITGRAGSIETDGASVDSTVNAHGRSSETYIEYGPNGDYGSTTTAQSIGAANSDQSIDQALSGLSSDTEYHYRAVVENDLGVKAYGVDRTFKTAATPKTGCDLDDTGYGCAKFCEAHPNAGDCIDPVAGLSDLIASSSASKVRRGGKVVVRTWITSTGTKEASGVKVCASGPKRLVRIQGKACRSFGNVAPGRTVKAQFTVKVKPKAKRRARAALKFVATSQELGNKTAQVKVAVR